MDLDADISKSVRNIFKHRHFHTDVDRWILFVDGKNMTIRAQDIAREKGVTFIEGPYFQRDKFIWPYLTLQSEIILRSVSKKPPLRSYYYTSVIGDEQEQLRIQQLLWGIAFHPEVFKKARNRKSKGVDITLTKDVLCHAFMGNYDLAVIVSGDADYIPVIEEVKRMGKMVYLAFFDEAKVDPRLIMAADMFEPIPFELLPVCQPDDESRGCY